MRGVDRALETLKPVAVEGDVVHRLAGVIAFRELVAGEKRLFVSRTEIDPEQSARLAYRIDGRSHLLADRCLRMVWCFQDRSVGCEFPAVIEATKPVAFAAAEGQRGAAMHAVLIEESESPILIAPKDEILAD